MRTALSLAGNSGGLIPGKAQQPHEQRPDNGVAASVGTVNVGTDGDACDCTLGLYGHRERVCTEVDSAAGTRPTRVSINCASVFSRTVLTAELFRPAQVLILFLLLLLLLIIIILIIMYIYHTLITPLPIFSGCPAAKADCNFTTAGLCDYRQGCRESVMTNWTVEKW